jgi:biopolymer transport protein ExbB
VKPLLEILDAAGFVGPILLALSMLMWWAIGWRWWSLRGPITAPVDDLLDGRAGHTLLGQAVAAMQAAAIGRRDPRAFAEEAVVPFREAFASNADTVRSVVAIAPLAGLLGTVTGMIETFDSLGSMQIGGIGAGIGEAMISTQMGLVVAVPGLLMGALLERRHAQIDDALDAILDRLGQGSTP